jgi:hypothetical protein
VPRSIINDIHQFDEQRMTVFLRYSHQKNAKDVVQLLLNFTRIGVQNRELRCHWLGVCPIPGFLCYSQEILTRRLSLKKSSIDSLFLTQRYRSTRDRKQFLPLLHQALPSLTDDTKWTARTMPGTGCDEEVLALTGSGEDKEQRMAELTEFSWDAHCLGNVSRVGFSRDSVPKALANLNLTEPIPVDVFLAFMAEM